MSNHDYVLPPEAEVQLQQERSSTTYDEPSEERDHLLSGEEGSIDMTRRHSTETYSDEEEGWDLSFEEDNADSQKLCEQPALRYSIIGASIGFLFLLLKITLTVLGHGSSSHDDHHGHRVIERTYYNGTDYFDSTVIFISLDGFRGDYLDRNCTPHLLQLAQKGLRAEYMHPSFPPNTFPNHWTLVTGLYPESHGIVANEFFDPHLDELFSYTAPPSIRDHPHWWGGQPIWEIAMLQGKKWGSVMWPGSDVAMSSVQSNHIVPFNHSLTPLDIMDATLRWLDLPTHERPHLITSYIPHVDSTGHSEGPEGDKIDSMLKQTDTAIGYLMEQLVVRHLEDHVHIVIVSDHGMTSTKPSNLIFYDDILSKESLSLLRRTEAAPLLDLRPKADAPPHTVQKVYQELVQYTQSHPEPHFQVYLRENVPERFHYSASDRITPIVVIPDVGYTFTTHATTPHASNFTLKGNHGFDHMAPDMRAIFIASGPKLTQWYDPGTVVVPFYNVEVFEFLSKLLNINAIPTNGTLHGMFIPAPSSPLS